MKGLALILSHNIKQFTNLWHFCESIYEVPKRLSGGVLKKSLNLGKTYRDFFRFWHSLPSQQPKQN